MFDHDALDLIQKTAVQASEIRSLFDGRAIAVPKGMDVENAEKWADTRFRFVGSYVTTALSEFMSYTLARSGSHGKTMGPASVFVHGASGRAVAFFNLGTPVHPGHADDVAKLYLENTAAYSAVLKTEDCSFSQKGLVELLEDWFDHVVPVYSGEDPPARATLSAAIDAIRNITVSASAETNTVEGDLARSASTFSQVEARSRNKLPSGFNFTCSPYAGFEPRTFNLRLSVRSSGDKPALVLRAVGMADIKDQIATEFEQMLRDGIGADVAVYRGQFTP